MKQLVVTLGLFFFIAMTGTAQEAAPPKQKITPEQRINQTIEIFDKQLDLTDEQEQQLTSSFTTMIDEMKAVQTDYQPKIQQMRQKMQTAMQSAEDKKQAQADMKEIKGEYQTEMQEMKKKMQTIQAENQARMQEILNDEQQQKLMQMQQQAKGANQPAQ